MQNVAVSLQYVFCLCVFVESQTKFHLECIYPENMPIKVLLSHCDYFLHET